MAETNTPDLFAMSSGVPGIQGDMRPKPKFADRISKKIIWVAVGGLFLVLGVFFIAFDAMDAKNAQPTTKEEEAAKKKDADIEKGTPAELKDAKSDGTPVSPSLAITTPKETPPSDPVDSKTAGTAGSVLGGKQLGGVSGVPAMGNDGKGLGLGGRGQSDQHDSSGGAPMLTPEQQAKKEAENKRNLRAIEARTAGLSMKGFSAGSGGGAENAGAATTAALSNLLTAAQQSAGAGGMMPVAAQQNTKGDAEQDEKLDFIKNASKDDRGYHPHVPMKAISPNEIKFGTYLPMVLEQGMNSDQPGMVTARITEDVFDTITGCRLLIPAMSKAIGKYDSKVALGQNRSLIVWNGMYFADGSELNLAGMQGYDTSGAAGMESEVDNHYLRLFGLTFGMSMITAGVQMSVPQSNSTNTAPTPAQAVATALAQQYGQLGAQILGKYMAVQPTLKNYPGERFTIMVPRTMVFKKVWRNRCGGSEAKVAQ